MRIGIDARELCGRPTGVGRYLHGLLIEWSRSPRARAHEFILYAHEPLNLTLESAASSETGPGQTARSSFIVRLVPGSGGTWWEQRQLPSAIRRDRLAAYFAPGYTAPLRLSIPLVVAIHDVSFAAHPEWFHAREGWRRRFLSRRAARSAAAVITISEFSRGELVQHLGADRQRIHVIPPGIDSFGGADRPAATGERVYVLYVGSIFNRRHLPDLIQAFSSIARAHPHAYLDIVGDNRSYPSQNIRQAIEHAGLDGRVEWREYVSDAELAALYRRARAFAFLSEYEGLGLTPLEALAAGIPAVLLDTAVARESCGDAALYAAKGDLGAIAGALERLIYDEPTRARLLTAAPAVLARYDWREAADRTLAVIEAASATSR